MLSYNEKLSQHILVCMYDRYIGSPGWYFFCILSSVTSIKGQLNRLTYVHRKRSYCVFSRWSIQSFLYHYLIGATWRMYKKTLDIIQSECYCGTSQVIKSGLTKIWQHMTLNILWKTLSRYIFRPGIKQLCS